MANGKMKFSFCQNKEKLNFFKLLVCYLDISSNFSKEGDKLKNVNFHASMTRSCLLFGVCRLPFCRLPLTSCLTSLLFIGVAFPWRANTDKIEVLNERILRFILGDFESAYYKYWTKLIDVLLCTINVYKIC